LATSRVAHGEFLVGQARVMDAARLRCHYRLALR
jgi:hypothetical protein